MTSALAPYVSIIVPVFKRTEWIGRCIGALDSLTAEFFFDVVIVDDGSPNQKEIEDAVDAALAVSALPVKFFRKENGGPAAARNFGVARSSGSILCFLDDDSVVDAGWLSAITAPMIAAPGVSVVSGMIRSYDRESAVPMLLEKHVYKGFHWATCNIAYRRDAFLALNGFDERFKEASWEDNDLGLRARWAGYRQVHSEKAVVHHPHEQCLDEYRRKCLVNGRGAAAFTKKYLFKKPLWAVAVPIAMSRNLLFAVFPAVLHKRISGRYLKFLWSYDSLVGFIGSFIGRKRGNNQQG